MVFGRNKKKGAGAEAPPETDGAQSATEAPKPAAQKKRKPAELLSSVVKESTLGAAVDLLKQNEAFALPNKTSWVGLLLSADDIGGLSQKQKNDATKGSIIELITSDEIQVIATKPMLDSEFLGIIPSTKTLDRMSEYSLLTDVSYYWALFYVKDEALEAETVRPKPVPFAEVLSIARGEKTISDILPDVWGWGGGVAEPGFSDLEHAPAEAERELVGAAVSAGASASLGAPALEEDPLGSFDFGDDGGDSGAVDYSALSEEDDNLSNFEDFESQFESSDLSLGDEDEDDELSPSWQSDDLEADEGSDDDDEEQGSADYLAYVEDNKDRVVDETEVRSTIARRFLSNDLDLFVDLAEFESTFATSAPAIAIEIADDPSDWMGSQVAQLSRQANAELALLHRNNTDQLRELFIETMALHVEKTMAVVSPDTPGSQYFVLMEGAKKDFEAQRAAAPQEMAAQRREITDRFNAEAESRATQAAAHARTVYMDKNRPKLERDIAEVGLELDRRFEEQYAHDRQTVLEMRRKDANVRMDIGTNRIFELLRERLDEQRENERALLEDWNGRLVQYIDEHRKDDTARAMVLTQQLARENQVDILKAEHKVRLKEMRDARRDREEELNDELRRIRQDALDELQARQVQWQTSLRLAQEGAGASGKLVEKLTEQMANIGSTYEERFQGEIRTLKSDKDSLREQLDQQALSHKRYGSILIALVVIAAVAALAVGVVIGIGMAP